MAKYGCCDHCRQWADHPIEKDAHETPCNQGPVYGFYGRCQSGGDTIVGF